MQIPITGLPQISDSLKVEAEFIQGDASLRRRNIVRLCISWLDETKEEEEEEQGFELFLCEPCLRPSKPYSRIVGIYHDTRCMFKRLQDAKN
ncbi:hypothetical protein LCGC14_2836940 [marine sediment metagenome]|uniref:Uncharacterized protein n=1 Tax=marine sediment metagenome TaxID=412755 RepID=A0A0F9B3G9_9ZZZZ